MSWFYYAHLDYGVHEAVCPRSQQALQGRAAVLRHKGLWPEHPRPAVAVVAVVAIAVVFVLPGRGQPPPL